MGNTQRCFGRVWGVLASGAICASPLAAQGETQNPHGTLQVEIDCQACHTAAGWRPAKSPMEFDHDEQTDFPLRDSHRESDCATCHLELLFSEPQLAASDCAACHVDVHLGNLSPDCQACHRETSFDDLDGPGLHTMTAFPLTGSHLQVTCETCHTDDRGGAFTTLNSDCFACHEENYRLAGVVDHVTAGFPTDCRQCHTTVTWTGGVPFDHPTVANGYPLIGAHGDLRCASCHLPPDGTLKFQPAGPDDCATCHQMDYDREHSASGFPTTCLDCHNQNSWGGAEFDHAVTGSGFALLGAHRRIACDRCHIPPSGTVPFQPAGQDDCIACHQTDYDREHTGSGFPTTCLSCHTNDTFMGADFRDHDAQFFPIYSGKHANRWANDCSTCHTVANDFKVFTCFACHEHNQTAMDDEHKDEPGYAYQSSACLSCHPDGRNN